MAKVKDLREQPDAELLSLLESSKEELFNLRFQMATGQLDNPSRIKIVRHDVARILTVLRQRQTEEELEAAVVRADQEALAESRLAQARGEKKGVSLADAAQEAQIEDEAAAGAVGPPPEET
jgi:large subunit ribosomal protein L29